jgi:DNA-binding response OmpR family regulator
MKKVLVVEDDEDTQKIYQQAFTQAGFQTIPAFDAESALPLALNQLPDLIVLDIMLPGKLNGFDVLEQIKKSEETAKIPVLVLTNLESEKKVAMDIGAADYFIKANTSINDVVERAKQLV